MMTGRPWAYLLFAAIVGCYVVARAAMVPWVHDECASLFWFVERDAFMPFSAHWDANNHILSSAIGTASYKLSGLSLFASRIGSVIAFLVFAWATYRIGSLVADRLVRWCLWVALLLCPFMLEFFSLFRGYGLEIAFWSLALDGLVRYLDSFRTLALVQALVGMLLGNAAVLALVPLWALVLGILGMMVVWRWKRMVAMERGASVFAWLFLGLVPVLFGLRIAFELRAQGLLYHGGTEGFLAVTVVPILRYMTGTDHRVVGLLVILIVVMATIVAVRARSWRSPAFIIAALLWGDIAMRVGMAHLLGINYPKDRAALHLVPLAILLIAFASDRLVLQRPNLRYASLILLLLPVRTVFTANVDHTSIWPEQSVPTRFVHRLADMQRGLDRPLIVGSYHQLTLCLPYAARLAEADIGVVDATDFPQGSHDARIADGRFLAQALPGYHEVDSAPANGLHLLLRNAPLRTTVTHEHPIVQQDARAEFIEVWRSDPRTTGEVIVEVTAGLATDTSYLDLQLVISAKDSAGNDLLYNAASLALLRPGWKGERFRTAVRVPAVPGATDRVVYFWNVQRASYHLSEGRVVIRVMDSTDHY